MVGESLHIVVMGVAGCGKSTVAAALAAALQLPFIEGDAFHTEANIARMHRGIPLTDVDRAGWLERLAEALQQQPEGAVLACSALRRAYRERLRKAVPALWFLHLAISPAQAHQRVGGRRGHYFPDSLLGSQFETLESPAGELRVITVDAGRSVAEIVATAQQALAAC